MLADAGSIPAASTIFLVPTTKSRLVREWTGHICRVLHARRSEREGGGDAPAIRDATGGDNRQIDRIDNLRNKRHGARLRIHRIGQEHAAVLVAVEMRGYLANSPRELTVPVEANQR